MNVDPTQALEQEQQQPQSTITGLAEAEAALALLISPSSPSSTSTVSPTVSSISKNSSTDEIDENTADAEEQAQHQRQQQQQQSEPLTTAQSSTERQQSAPHDDVHRSSSVCHESYQQSATSTEARQPSDDTTQATDTMTAETVVPCLLETDTLLAQSVPESNATTTIKETTEPGGQGDTSKTDERAARSEATSASPGTLMLANSATTMTSHLLPLQELTTEALLPGQLSTSSSSTASSPSIAEEQSPAMLEGANGMSVATDGQCLGNAADAASNNNRMIEVNLPPTMLLAADGCNNNNNNNNDRFNNNKSNDEDSGVTQEDASGDLVAIADRRTDVANEDTDDGDLCAMIGSAVTEAVTLTEGVPVSAPEATHEAVDTQTTTACRCEPEGNEPVLTVAPVEIVQITPEPSTNTSNTAVARAANKDEVVAVSSTNTQTCTAAEPQPPVATAIAENNTITSAIGVEGSLLSSSSSPSTPLPPPRSSSTCPSSSVSSASSSSSSAASSSATSSESSPPATPALAASQQETEAIAAAEPKPTMVKCAVDRCPCDSREEHSLAGEGLLPPPPAAPVIRRPRLEVPADAEPMNSTFAPAVKTTVEAESDASRVLTLAEELSLAAAEAVAASAPPVAAATRSAAAVTSETVTLPKSAAGTASSSSSSPVLHSSLKKSTRMGVLAGGASRATSERLRRVSFPKDSDLITGYLDPVSPWASTPICDSAELLELYRASCNSHGTLPLQCVIDHLQSIDFTKDRVPLLSLKDQNLSYGSCEALEPIFKHVRYRCIDLSHSGLDDLTASVMFDIIEYYEAANELDISDNLQMSSKTWTDCINMIKKSKHLNVLITRGPTISDYQVTNLAKALSTSAMHTLKLEHCVLSQQPIASLCTILMRNNVLRELWLAHNQLICEDAQQIANLLRKNFYIQLIDISNNRIGDKGVEVIVSAIVDQSVYFKDVQEKKRKSALSFSDLSSSLNNINSSKNFFPTRLRPTDSLGSIASDSDSTTSPTASPLTTPVTPPSTPALPSIETSTAEDELNSTAGCRVGDAIVPSPVTAPGMYTKSELDQEINPPPTLPVPPPTSVAPPIANLVETSTKPNNSVSLQTSDRVRPETGLVGVTAEEEALLRLTSTSSTVAMDRDFEKSTAKTVQTEGPAESMVEDQSLELLLSLEQSESPVPHAPKKARLAKQDSILSEFEATIIDLPANDGKEQQKPKQRPKQQQTATVVASVMDEDISEMCTDYDDDGSNLKISQENLYVDLAITTTAGEERSGKTISVPKVGQFTAVTLPAAPLKKDELQLLIEKSQQHELQLEKAINAREAVNYPSVSDVPVAAPTETGPPVATSKNESKSAISGEQLKKRNRAQSSGKALHMKRVVKMETNNDGAVLGALSHSLESVGDDSDFEISSSPYMTTAAPSSFPNERSFSSESLNSETSVDSNDSKSSLKIIESKFATKNGTLERQQSNVNRDGTGPDAASTVPTGLQVLVLWNNEITRKSAHHFAKLLEKTTTLDTLNVGSNLLCNSFVSGIGASLKANTSLTNLGLQGAHLSDKGAKAMAEVIEFGGNSSLQRIDMRNNNIQKAGLEALNEAMKSNKSVNRIDLDDTPRRVKDTTLDGVGSEYSRLVNNIRAQCERNKNPPEPSEPITSNTQVRRARVDYLSSRKISLTCQSIKTSPSAIADRQHLLDPSGGGCKKPSGRLRSPLPSPIPSPIASPVPSPSRNRFHVSRVSDSTGGGGSLTSVASTSPSPSSTGSSPTLFFPSNSRFRVVTVAEPDLAGAKGASIRSSSTISLPSKSSYTTSSPPLSSSSVAIGIGVSPLMGGASNRRPVCSSAPTFSSFSPSSPSSPLAAAVPSVRMNSPSPLLPPAPSNTFATNNTMLPPTLLPAGVIPMIVPLGATPTMPQIIPQNVTQLQPLQPSAMLFPPQSPLQLPQVELQTCPLVPVPNSPIVPTLSQQTVAPKQPPHALQSPQQTTLLQSLPQPQLGAANYHPTVKVRHSSTPHNSNSTLHDSVLSSTSIESPDLEVKRFMAGGIMDDSCCSSISGSIDSIDNANFNNTSLSSADESFDVLTASGSPQPQAVVTARSLAAASNSSAATRPYEESTLIPRTTAIDGNKDTRSPSVVVVGMPLQGASSQESLYDVHDLSASSNSSSLSATNWTLGTKPPLPTTTPAPAVLAPTSHSNESTLTSTQHLEKEAKPSGGSPVAEKVAAPRVRKTSWIHTHIGGGGSAASSANKQTDSSSSGGSTPTPSGGGSGYPPAIEKLLSLFNPSNLFSSSKSSSVSPPNVDAGAPAVAGGGQHGGSSQPPSRKESPMGGLFYWAHGGGGSNAGSNNSTITNSPSSSGHKKDDDRVLKVNVSPESTPVQQQLHPLQNQTQTHHPLQADRAPSVNQQQQSVEHMPPQMKVEMKENISPENTITNKLLTSVATTAGSTGEPIALVATNPVPMATAPHARVIFQLGGDYDESEDDIDTLTNKYGNATVGGHYYGSHQSGASSLIGSTTSNSSGISVGSAMSAGEGAGCGGRVASPSANTTGERQTESTVGLSHLGQLARDSLSIFKNPSLTSQDSMSIRSMDSLPEMTIESAVNYNPLTAVMTTGPLNATSLATSLISSTPPTTRSASTSTPPHPSAEKQETQ
ncbi:serine-rich adhesin for platelets [Anopheles bellator]|uniref:serine-rich adhesin for platelets n=1 Tax=Anopheles bellator TaxID=139047 RepID=UPI002648C87E|nr:serine-rich adhesin for platelets [Anopheles bellator]